MSQSDPTGAPIPAQPSERHLLGEEVCKVPKPLKPGELAPASGQYAIVGPRGGQTGQERTVTRGEPLPPTPEPDQRYVLVDRTHNRSGRGK